MHELMNLLATEEKEYNKGDYDHLPGADYAQREKR
jgi:hypothetical protein